MHVRKLMLAIGAMALVGGEVLADPIHHIGNTLLIKRATGTGKMLYRADHTFTLYAIGGSVIHGKWIIRDSKLCHEQMNTEELKPFCVPDDPHHKVGDTWNVKSPDGIPEQLTLVAGQK